MPVTNVFAVMAVAIFDEAIAWYERLMGREADNVPMDGLADWQVTATGGIQVFLDFERAGGGAVTLIVDDLVEHVAGLAAADLPVSALTTGEMARFATIGDPEGNTITFAEPLRRGG
jgi:catechol 2,3-dioxygenase-like lactoylglutathione lyase family enzyme